MRIKHQRVSGETFLSWLYPQIEQIYKYKPMILIRSWAFFVLVAILSGGCAATQEAFVDYPHAPGWYDRHPNYQQAAKIDAQLNGYKLPK